MLLAREVVQPGAFLGRPWETMALGWALWVGYALERWIDARHGYTKGGTYRHAFVQANQLAFLAVALLGLAGLLYLAAPTFAVVADAFSKYRSVWFLAPLFLLLGTRLGPNAGWLYRSLAVALILTLLAAKQSVRLVETGVVSHLIYLGFALPIFALVLANLAVTRRAEETTRTWQLRLGPMFAAVLGSVFTLKAVPGAAGPSAAAAFGGASLWFLDRRSEGIPAEMVRARADLLTLLALVAGLWIR
ncbi:MAG: hypothetical protein RIR91_1279 [Verrucomicrobiota bacterium]